MANITFDGQSFSIDNRRVWLVSGAIHYPRTPRAQWRSRIRAAKQAGLNCIETYVFWNFHEPKPGVFDFEGDKDLRAFVQMIADEGMYCILRPGPYVCAEWDFGGLPAWINTVVDPKGKVEMKLRQGSPLFLEACSRYLRAVMEQVEDLQVTSKVAGPIILVQAENEWLCHNPLGAQAYLREIVRYLRENGCTTPINECNNLWQDVEGALSTWNANTHLAQDLRQLAVVQPSAPRLVTEFWTGWFDSWNHEHSQQNPASLVLHRLAQMLAVGAQYNLYMFHGGTNFGFNGGRTIGDRAAFITTSYDYDAPLEEAGGRGDKYAAVKRISTFASSFDHVFAHLDPTFAHTAGNPAADDSQVAVIQQRGSQGNVSFIFKGSKSKAAYLPILLENGHSFDVPLGHQNVAWILNDTNLEGVATLTYSSLSPWTFAHKKMLVLFGPPASKGLVCINDAILEVETPTGKKPIVEEFEDLTLVILSTDQVDAAYVYPEGIALYADGLDDNNRPIAGESTVTTISIAGKVGQIRKSAARKPTLPTLDNWEQAGLNAMLSGASDAYTPIEGPASLEHLGVNQGYGWYRIATTGAKAETLLAPEAGDRLHLFQQGKSAAMLGLGPGAEYGPVDFNLNGDVVVLADNLGRFNFSWSLGEGKGLFGHIHAVKPIKLAKPAVVSGMSPDPFLLGAYFQNLRKDDRQAADAFVWKAVKPVGRKPLIVDIQDLPVRAMLFVNDEPIGMYDPHMTAGMARWVLEPGEQITGGQNEFKLALFTPFDGSFDPLKFVKIYQSTNVATAKSTWSFAPWAPPQPDDFGVIVKSYPAAPCWYRSSFNVTDASTPLWLEPAGMSKGQIFLNGHNVGRYFVATGTGKAVPPQGRYYLPEAWLHVDQPNELMLFDEHGKDPKNCRLVYDAHGPYS